MLSLIALAYFASSAFAQTWCGKHYLPTLPATPPGGLFPIPAVSDSPLLALRCSPAIRPYLAEDDKLTSTVKSILVDAPITHQKIANAVPVDAHNAHLDLAVTVSVNGKTLAHGTVPLNATKHELAFSLSSLKPQKEAFVITCTATLGSQTFSATGSLSYLPNPPAEIGSVTKMDLRTGTLLARPANGKGGPFAPVFPIGFYTSFGGYLDQDFTIPSVLASQGFTVVHPVPSFDNLTALEIVLDKMQEAGLYLMYDMRNTYMNATAVTAEVNRIKSRPNLLLWYTGDEPDGTSDPLTATVTSRNLIQSLDGGDDIVLQDTYMVGNNVTFSSQWSTVCNTTYGDCGCDNCKGSFEDISTRMDEFAQRLFVNGWERTKAVWTVPQGFGNDTYWKREPTGPEFVVESIVGINHGGLGVVSWDDPTTPEIKASASLLAQAMPKLTPFILSSEATFRQVTVNRVDVGLWTVGARTLVLAANMNYATTNVDLASLGLHATAAIEQVFKSGTSSAPARDHLVFGAVGSGAFIVG
ncbi:hypothetical protein D9619_009061 [Psilocybe cf. subviscida]|uniref:Uncharacterized protein n=1 Tax=Psilocybe cf. subviscida TaxID=2480587 RepID=A0A8H5BUA2_9AGAR|nr:hypothetical protein D9619_009061 [Psilocybe cf. subviscida]